MSFCQPRSRFPPLHPISDPDPACPFPPPSQFPAMHLLLHRSHAALQRSLFASPSSSPRAFETKKTSSSPTNIQHPASSMQTCKRANVLLLPLSLPPPPPTCTSQEFLCAPFSVTVYLYINANTRLITGKREGKTAACSFNSNTQPHTATHSHTQTQTHTDRDRQTDTHTHTHTHTRTNTHTGKSLFLRLFGDWCPLPQL